MFLALNVTEMDGVRKSSRVITPAVRLGKDNASEDPAVQIMRKVSKIYASVAKIGIR